MRPHMTAAAPPGLAPRLLSLQKPRRDHNRGSHTYLKSSGLQHNMNSVTTARDLLYPTEWICRFFIVAVLIRVARPDWTYASSHLANALVSPLTYYLFVIAAAGALVVQIWVGMKYISSRRHNVPLHQ